MPAKKAAAKKAPAAKAAVKKAAVKKAETKTAVAKAPRVRKTPAPPPKGSKAEVDALLKLIVGSLEDDKAEAVVTIDMEGKSSVADYMVICNGRSSRQVAAISEHLVERLGAAKRPPLGVSGQRAGDWVVIDAGDIIVHVFRPEVRTFYNLEKMWGLALPEGMGEWIEETAAD